MLGLLEQRLDWLENGPAYGGDVNAFYQRAWHDLEHSRKAQNALAYLALAEGPITDVSLDALVGCEATDAAWEIGGSSFGQRPPQRLVNFP